MLLFPRRRRYVRARVKQAGKDMTRQVDRRLPLAEGGGLLRKVFPDHWSFLLGEIALYSFLVVVLTGVYLTLFFKPGMAESIYHGSYTPLNGIQVSDAYRSTLDLSFDVRGGLLVRQIHHWGALVFVVAIGVHMLRIFFTGAFRRPREANWIIGLTLFVLSLLEGFAGYSLPDDLLSGTGLRTASTIVYSIPIVGTYLGFFVFGGPYPGDDIISRLYSVHILLVPGALLALLTVHLILVFYLKHTQWAGPGKTERNVVGKPMFPQFSASSGGLFLMTFGLLAALAGVAQINPVWQYGPYVPDQVSIASQPDWYVGFLEGSLRLMPPWETTVLGHTIMWNVFIPALVVPGVLFLVLYLYPFVEKWITGDHREHHLCDRPRDRPVRTAVGAAGITYYAVLLAAGGNDVIASAMNTSVNGLTWFLRGSFVFLPPLVFAATRLTCLALQDNDRQVITEGKETGWVQQTIIGGFEERHQPLSREERARLDQRPRPAPLPSTSRGQLLPPSRRARLRAALSAWFYRDRVVPPKATSEEKSPDTTQTDQDSKQPR